MATIEEIKALIEEVKATASAEALQVTNKVLTAVAAESAKFEALVLRLEARIAELEAGQTPELAEIFQGLKEVQAAVAAIVQDVPPPIEPPIEGEEPIE